MVSKSSIKKKSSKKPSKKNPNMRTRAWGPVAWSYITFSLMGYPDKKPTAVQKNTYKRFLVSVGKTLPCNLCRTSYAKFVKEIPITSRVLSGRKNLVMWFFKIHNRVNKKLGCRQLTAIDMEKKYRWYDKFRAMSCSPTMNGCVKAVANVRKPRRTKIVTCVDKQALRLRRKDAKKSKKSKKISKKISKKN